ncbi:MAG TPA: hypothetical protein VNR60_02540 [Croceibacterium sp.]|nr:hypothetical protein [Croceibacterium sp.]
MSAATLIEEMLSDARHGWSIGTFGAIAEFMRDEDEDARITRDGEAVSIVTPRAGIRVLPNEALRAVAFDTLSSDGETWGQSVAFCLPVPAEMEHTGIRWLGKDTEALREEDRDADLFDLGAGRGHVRFCARTRDAAYIEALKEIEGTQLFDPANGKAQAETFRSQPHRVAISPAGRVEVYAPIPLPGGTSPEGPHTHLLPKMVASGKTHASNSPIPEGFQPVLSLHPRTPWRDALGQRVPFDAELDALFDGVLAQFALPEDRAVRRSVEGAVADSVEPDAFEWPRTRRGRAQARIALRRLAQADPQRVIRWRQLYDRVPEPDEDAALQA